MARTLPKVLTGSKFTLWKAQNKYVVEAYSLMKELFQKRAKILTCESQFVMDCIPGLKEFTNDKKFTTDLSSHAIRVKFQSLAPSDKLPYFVKMLNKIQAVEEEERIKHKELKEKAKQIFAMGKWRP